MEDCRLGAVAQYVLLFLCCAATITKLNSEGYEAIPVTPHPHNKKPVRRLMSEAPQIFFKPCRKPIRVCRITSDICEAAIAHKILRARVFPVHLSLNAGISQSTLVSRSLLHE
jgi:hypothetical protein